VTARCESTRSTDAKPAALCVRHCCHGFGRWSWNPCPGVCTVPLLGLSEFASAGSTLGRRSGLEGGIQVGVEAGFEAALGIETPEDVALVRTAIIESFRAWENPVLRFDITFDATVVRGGSAGFEIDILAVPFDDPIFNGQLWFGIVDEASRWDSLSRTLTNGTLARGYIITGGDIFINSTLALAMEVLLANDQERLDALQRLVTHEAGHLLGLGHPNDWSLDTDLDPFNAMPIDPADPYANLFWQPNYDPTAVMAASPCGGGLSVCPALFVKDLQPDDIGGRDALYPIPEPSAVLLFATDLAGLAAAGRRRRP